jgi:hypothetical protein
MLISMLILPALIQNREITSLKKLVQPIVLWFVAITLAAGTFIAIQGTLWYLATGRVLINAYSIPSAQGRFSVSNIQNLPQILWGSDGLLLFSPVFGFALLGLFAFDSVIKRLSMVSIQISLAVVFSVITLWGSSTRMGGYGSRMFADFVPLFAVGIASMYALLIKKQYSTRPLSFAIGICVCLNLFQMFSYWSGDWVDSRFLFNLIH